MVRKLTLFGVMAVLVLAVAAPASATRVAEGGRADGPVVFVESQGLYFDSIIVADNVPNKGPFQELIMALDGSLSTQFGPGDTGYVGGRWALQTPEGVKYFICPLLGPGRIAP